MRLQNERESGRLERNIDAHLEIHNFGSLLSMTFLKGEGSSAEPVHSEQCTV